MTPSPTPSVALPSNPKEILAYAEEIKVAYFPAMHAEIVLRLMSSPRFFELAAEYFRHLDRERCLVTLELWMKHLNDAQRQTKLLESLFSANRYDLPPKDIFGALPTFLWAQAWSRLKLTHHQIESFAEHYAYVSPQPERVFDLIHYLAPLTALPLNTLMLVVQMQASRNEKLPAHIEADAHAFFSGKRPSHYAPRVLLLRALYPQWTGFLEPWEPKAKLNARQSDRLLTLYTIGTPGCVAIGPAGASTILHGRVSLLEAQSAEGAVRVAGLVREGKLTPTPAILAYLQSHLSGHQLAGAVGGQA